MNDTPNSYGDTVKNDLGTLSGYAKSAGSGIFSAIGNFFSNYPMAKSIVGALAGFGLASWGSKFLTAKLPFGGGALSFVAGIIGAVLGFRAPMLMGQGNNAHAPDNLTQSGQNTGNTGGTNTTYTPYRSTDDSGVAPIDRSFGSIDYRIQSHDGGTPASIITPAQNPNDVGSLSAAPSSPASEADNTRNLISSNTGSITAQQDAADGANATDNTIAPSATAESALLSHSGGKFMPNDLKSVLDPSAPPTMEIQDGRRNDIDNVIYMNADDIARSRYTRTGPGMIG